MKRMFIVPALLVMIIVFWHFLTSAALYDPLARVDLRKPETGAGEALKNEFTVAWGDEIIENNLFSPDRKRPSPRARSSAPVDIKQPEMALKGVTLTRGGDYEAYLQIDKQQPVLIKKGDRLDDIQVVEIKEKTVQLKWKHKIIELTL
jgi:hypothetical protein